MIKKISNVLFQCLSIRQYFNPFIDYFIDCMDGYSGINVGIKRDTPLVVVLYSDREHFDRLPITLYSLLNQTLKPDKVILYLDNKSESLAYLPYEITQFVKNGLEICFTDNQDDYTALSAAFKSYSNSIVVSASDNFYYKKDWLKTLYLSYVSNPAVVHAYSANQFTVIAKLKCLANQDSVSYKNIPDLRFGTLFPPKCFSIEVLRKDIYLKHVLNNPDIWFWVMALVHNKKIKLLQKGSGMIYCLSLSRYIKTNRLKNMSSADELDNLKRLYGNSICSKIN